MEIEGDTNRETPKLPSIIGRTSGLDIHPEGGSSGNIQRNEREITLRAWEKPGVWGTTRRFLRNVQRYIWDDPDKPKASVKFPYKKSYLFLYWLRSRELFQKLKKPISNYAGLRILRQLPGSLVPSMQPLSY